MFKRVDNATPVPQPSSDTTYNITFIDDNGIILLGPTEYDEGTPVSSIIQPYPSPTKPDSSQYRYTFTGWDPMITDVTSNAVYVAVYSAIPLPGPTPTPEETYSVTFLNDDGTILLGPTEYPAGTVVSDIAQPSTTPTKQSTTQYSYAFSGWNPELTAVTENAIYTATFTQTIRTYTIIWKDDSGNIIETETLPYGATPSHVAISKPSDAHYTYEFDKWEPTPSIVVDNAEYHATFIAHKIVDPTPDYSHGIVNSHRLNVWFDGTESADYSKASGNGAIHPSRPPLVLGDVFSRSTIYENYTYKVFHGNA
jgi:hypothetical protein